jgi:hypothetical protein
MAIDEVFAILNSLLQPWYQILRATIIIEILEAIYEVGMLSEMKIFSCFALLTHFAIVAVLEGADERDHLLMARTQCVLIHEGLYNYINSFASFK